MCEFWLVIKVTRHSFPVCNLSFKVLYLYWTLIFHAHLFMLNAFTGSTRNVWISQIQDLSQPWRLLHLQDQVVQFPVHRQQQIRRNLPPLLRVRITAGESLACVINLITAFIHLIYVLLSAAFSYLSRPSKSYLALKKK